MADGTTPLNDAARANSWTVAKMQVLEQKQLRAVREHLLGDPSALPRLQALDNQITALRAQLTPE